MDTFGVFRKGTSHKMAAVEYAPQLKMPAIAHDITQNGFHIFKQSRQRDKENKMVCLCLSPRGKDPYMSHRHTHKGKLFAHLWVSMYSLFLREQLLRLFVGPTRGTGGCTGTCGLQVGKTLPLELPSAWRSL